MQRVYRLLQDAREQGIIPWEWIVDETRAIERVSTWADPAEYARCVAQSYRRDFWDQQPHRVQVWSEKGTVRGVLAPVLDHYAVGFLPVHGFSSATAAHDIAEDDDGRDLIVLYVGDFDPSGMFMSEEDLPAAVRQVRRRPHQAEAHRAHGAASATDCRRSRRPISAKTRATNGSSPTMGVTAGSLTPWTRTICATASSGKSRS